MKRRRPPVHFKSALGGKQSPAGPPAGLWLALLAGALILITAALLILPPERGEGPWRGWRLLFVPEEIAEGKVLERLESAGIERILSESRQTLRLSAWDGTLEDLPLGLVDTRLLPGDPRLDRYVADLRAWFLAFKAAKKYRIFYIASSRATIGGDALDEAAKDISPDCLLLGGEKRGSPRGRLVGPGAALLAGSGLLLVRRKGRNLRAAAILPWLVLASAGGGRLLALAWAGLFTLLVAGIEPLIAEYLRSGHVRGLGRGILLGLASSFFLLVPALGSLLATPWLAPSFLLTFFSGILLIAALVLLLRAIEIKKRRSPFVALPIAETAWRRRARANKVLVGAACCAAALGLALSLSGRFQTYRDSKLADLVAPLPERPESKSLPSPGNAQGLAAARREGEPPDLADWLIHRARQEALFIGAFGREDPDPFAPIGLPMPGGNYKPLLEFTDPWARAAYRSLPESSIEALLRDQGGYRRASLRPVGATGSQPLAPFDAILYILFLAFPLYGALTGLPRSEKAGSVHNSYEIP